MKGKFNQETIVFLITATIFIFFSIRDDTHAWEVWRWPWSVRWGRLFTLVR